MSSKHNIGKTGKENQTHQILHIEQSIIGDPSSPREHIQFTDNCSLFTFFPVTFFPFLGAAPRPFSTFAFTFVFVFAFSLLLPSPSSSSTSLSISIAVPSMSYRSLALDVDACRCALVRVVIPFVFLLWIFDFETAAVCLVSDGRTFERCCGLVGSRMGDEWHKLKMCCAVVCLSYHVHVQSKEHKINSLFQFFWVICVCIRS